MGCLFRNADRGLTGVVVELVGGVAVIRVD